MLDICPCCFKFPVISWLASNLHPPRSGFLFYCVWQGWILIEIVDQGVTINYAASFLHVEFLSCYKFASKISFYPLWKSYIWCNFPYKIWNRLSYTLLFLLDNYKTFTTNNTTECNSPYEIWNRLCYMHCSEWIGLVSIFTIMFFSIEAESNSLVCCRWCF